MGKAERRKELREIINGMLKDKVVDLSQAGMAKQIGTSPAALNQWLQNKYKGSNTTIEEKIECWLKNYAASQEYTSKLPPDPDWVETPTARRILQTLELGQFMKKLVVVYGAAGSGKTKTSKYYLEQNPNVWMFTITKATSSVRGMLMMMCDQLNISDPGSGNRALEKAIVEKVRGTNGMLLIDEAQQAALGALEQLRQMQEAAEVGMALLGNDPLIDQMTGGFRGAKYAQLFSRIAKPTRIKETLEDDVLVLAQSLGIQNADTLRYLSKIGQLPGGLRGVVNTIQLAHLMGGGKKLNQTAIAEAWTTLTA